MELPKNDIYVRLVQLATYLNDKPEPKEGKIGRDLEEGTQIQIDKSKAVSYEEYPENYYVVKKIFKENDGLLAIIFERVYKDENGNTQKEGVLALGGSFSVGEPYKNPVEWYKDWILNNAKIGQNKIPPQFYSALGILDKYKSEYNINTVTGFSLGAILGGMIAKFNRHSDINAYLYNGGLPVELEKVLEKEYGNEINSDSLNMLTMLSQGDILTDFITVERGSGIYLSNRKEKKYRGHKISSHKYSTASDYDEIIQQGKAVLGEYSVSANKTDAGANVQINTPLPIFAKAYKKNLSEVEDKDVNELNVSDKHVIKEMPKITKSLLKYLKYLQNNTAVNSVEKTSNIL